MLEVVTGGEAHEAVDRRSTRPSSRRPSTRSRPRSNARAADATVSLRDAVPSFDAGRRGRARSTGWRSPRRSKAAVLEGRRPSRCRCESVEPDDHHDRGERLRDRGRRAGGGRRRPGPGRRHGADGEAGRCSPGSAGDRASPVSSSWPPTPDALSRAAEQCSARLPHRAGQRPVRVPRRAARRRSRAGRARRCRPTTGPTAVRRSRVRSKVTTAAPRPSVTEAPPRFSTADARQLEISRAGRVAEVRVPGVSIDDVAAGSARQLDGAVIRPQCHPERAASDCRGRRSRRAVGRGDGLVRRVVPRRARPSSSGTSPRCTPCGAPGLDAAVGPGRTSSCRTTPRTACWSGAVVVDGPGRSTQLRVELWGSPYWDVHASTPGAEYDVERPGVAAATAVPAAGRRPGVPGSRSTSAAPSSADGVGTRDRDRAQPLPRAGPGRLPPLSQAAGVR